MRCDRLVVSLVLLALLAPPAAFGQGDAEVAADLHDQMYRLEKLGFAGSIVVSREGRPIFARGYGLADRERGIPWTPSTVSTIGSITKQFTGAAILSLAEAGRLSVDDTIDEYFEDVPRDKEGITLHQLLTHSSGIVDLFDGGDWDAIGREEFVERALAQELAFAPGESYDYSNAGYSLLGAIIEQLTGASYEAYLRERLLLPAGMYETGYVLAPWGEARLANGYVGGERWGTVVERPFAEDGPYWVLRANGGIHSTGWDMLRWGEALLAGRPLSEASMKLYWGPHVDEGGGDSFYGYGWVVMDYGGVELITHNGGNGILFADMAIVPSAGLVMVIQTNVLSEFRVAGQLLGRLGARVLLGRDLPHVPDWDRSGERDLAALAGDYALEGGGRLTLTVGDDELRVEAADEVAFSRLLSTRPVDAERARRLSQRIDEVVGAYVADKWRPLWKAYGKPGRLSGLEERGRARLAAAAEEHGPLRGHAVLGTAFRNERDVTLVRLEFERGVVYRAYVWDPEAEEGLLGVSGRGLDHVVHLLPEVDGGFSTWDPRVGLTRPVIVERPAAGAVRLSLGSDEPLVATRAE